MCPCQVQTEDVSGCLKLFSCITVQLSYSNKNGSYRRMHLASSGHCACSVHKTFEHLNFSIFTNISDTGVN